MWLWGFKLQRFYIFFPTKKQWECSRLCCANPAANGRRSSFPATSRSRLRTPSRSKGSSLRPPSPPIPPAPFSPLSPSFPLPLPFSRSSFTVSMSHLTRSGMFCLGPFAPNCFSAFWFCSVYLSAMRFQDFYLVRVLWADFRLRICWIWDSCQLVCFVCLIIFCWCIACVFLFSIQVIKVFFFLSFCFENLWS